MKTPLEKEHDKQRKNLLILQNGVRHAWSQNQLKTWRDVYNRLGYSPIYIEQNFPIEQRNKELTFPELREYLMKMEITLEERLKNESLPKNVGQTVGVSISEVNRPNTNTILSERNGQSSTTERNAITETSEEKNERPTEARIGQVNGEMNERNINIQHTLSFKEREKDSKKIETSDDFNSSKSVDKTTQKEKEENEEGLVSDKDYGLIPSPNEKAKHFWFQKKAIKQLYDKIVKEKRTGILLLAGTGTGKTYMVAGTERRLLDLEYHNGKTFSHMPYLYVTKTTILEQTKRVFSNLYKINPLEDIEIINIEQLRSKAGQFWVKEEVRIVDGQEDSFWSWKPNIQPCVIFLDESQGAKNRDSTQSKIIYAYNNLPKNVCLVSISATPFTRVSEAQAFAVSTHRPLDHLGFPPGTVLTNENWPTYAAQIAAPANPNDRNEAAIERLMKDLDDWVVRVKGVRPQFDAINGVKRIPFQSKEARQFYEKAWDRFLEKKKKAEEEVASGRAMILVWLQQFSMAAELCRAEVIADEMYKAVTERRKAACAAVKWKGTIIAVVQFLNSKYGVPRDNISLIWGGGQTQLTKKQKAKVKIQEMAEKLKDAGLDAEELLEDTGLDEVEDRQLLNLPEHLQLGEQSLDQRQREIDRFQSGKSLYCLYTFKAGGVGLSLHHTDELTIDWDRLAVGFNEWFVKIQSLPEKQRPLPGKARRKESGYAVEEDIPFVPVRPRENFVAPTYSPIELVQGLGRLPRLTSLSDTVQTLLFYIGTIEDSIAEIVSQGLRCLSKVVRQREKWMDVAITGRGHEIAEKLRDEKADEKGTMIDEGEGEDE